MNPILRGPLVPLTVLLVLLVGGILRFTSHISSDANIVITIFALLVLCANAWLKVPGNRETPDAKDRK